MLIGYARCSKPSQEIASQNDALLKAGCERIFEEHVSGAAADRPELAAAMAYARPGDQIVVYALNRLGRGVRQLLDTVDQLQARGIGFRSLTEHIDTETASGRLAFQLFAVLSNAEVEALRERTRAGLQAARARGRLGGRPKKLTSAKLSMAKALLADPSLTVQDVASEIGVGVSTLYRAIPGMRSASVDI